MNKKTYFKNLLEYCRTDKQRKVVNKLATGLSQSEVARELGVSTRSVERTIARIRKYAASVGYAPEANLKHRVPDGFAIKRISTFTNKDGDIGEWVIKEQKEVDKLAALQDAVNAICDNADSMHAHRTCVSTSQDQLLPVYISNDVHIGALMWKPETLDRDYDTTVSEALLKSAIDNLVARAPATKECIVADLGDLTEMDDFKNATPKSGHTLDVDGRYVKVLEVAMMSMIYFVEKALEKHEQVHFINISGNHDITTALTVRALVSAWFRNEPRVTVCTSPSYQKYFQFGSTLLGFAHGDGLRMEQAGEVMAMHNESTWSETKDRYFHFGHNHKDKVVDGRLCKAESHRNIAPLNAWASHAGFGRNAGTMKCIVYSKDYGEDTRITYNVRMNNEN